jgi:hypothetical protein
MERFRTIWMIWQAILERVKVKEVAPEVASALNE